MTDVTNDGPAKLPVVRSAGPKFFLVIGLSIAMAVPLFFIQLALSDRENTAATAATDVASGWGGPQTVGGPVLVVPYTVVRTQSVDGKSVQAALRFSAMLLPAALDIRMRSDVQIRRRGIFKVPVYTSQIAIAARFDKNEIAALAPTNAVMLWNEATAAILGSEPNKSVAG